MKKLLQLFLLLSLVNSLSLAKESLNFYYGQSTGKHEGENYEITGESNKGEISFIYKKESEDNRKRLIGIHYTYAPKNPNSGGFFLLPFGWEALDFKANEAFMRIFFLGLGGGYATYLSSQIYLDAKASYRYSFFSTKGDAVKSKYKPKGVVLEGNLKYKIVPSASINLRVRNIDLKDGDFKYRKENQFMLGFGFYF